MRSDGILGEEGTDWEMTSVSLYYNTFFDPKNDLSDQSITLMSTMICWWEASRPSGMVR